MMPSVKYDTVNRDLFNSMLRRADLEWTPDKNGTQTIVGPSGQVWVYYKGVDDQAYRFPLKTAHPEIPRWHRIIRLIMYRWFVRIWK